MGLERQLMCPVRSGDVPAHLERKVLSKNVSLGLNLGLDGRQHFTQTAHSFTYHPFLGNGNALVERHLAPRLLGLDGLRDDRVELLRREERARAHRLLREGTDRGLDVDGDHVECVSMRVVEVKRLARSGQKIASRFIVAAG